MRAIALLSVSGLLVVAVSCGGSSPGGADAAPPSGNDAAGGAAAGASGAGGGGKGGSAGANAGHAGASTGGASGASGHAGGTTGGTGGQSTGGKGTAGSGGASTGPATCADAHGPTGCCSADGMTVYYFDGTTVKSTVCVGGAICGWDSGNAYYACGSSGSPDPSGANPDMCGGDGAGNAQCPAGTGGTGGSGGKGGAAGASGKSGAGGKAGAAGSAGKSGASGSSGSAGASGSGGHAGASGGGVGGASGGASGSAGTSGGASGSAGTNGGAGSTGSAGSSNVTISPACESCAQQACPSQVSACTSDSACFACVSNPNDPACALDDAFVAAIACACTQCTGSGQCATECPKLACDAPPVVISQVYGGGGLTGAVFANDYVELFNRSATPVTLDGWSLQYASATGMFNAASPLTGVIQPGHYFLVAQGTPGTNGQPLPTPDGNGTLNMSSTQGKVALVKGTTLLGATCAGAPIVDLVAYGAASCAEGTPAPALSVTLAAIRAGAGCSDKNDNATDFTAATPNPRNSASATQICAACD